MIILIILIGCIIGFAIWGYCEERYILDSLYGAFLGAILGSLVGLLICLMGNLCCGPCNGPIEIQETAELVAIKDNLGIEGYNFLFSGSVKDELKYYYIYEEPQKGLTTNSIDADISYIKYVTEGTQPYMEEWVQRHESKVLYWLFFAQETGYTFYLPEGSVIQDYYQIDLEQQKRHLIKGVFFDFL